MAVSLEGNVDLAYNTDELRACGTTYGECATEVRKWMKKLDTCIQNLVSEGWTTNAGAAFMAMVDSNWKDNMEKYAGLLETLNKILDEASEEYDGLTEDYIRKTKLE